MAVLRLMVLVFAALASVLLLLGAVILGKEIPFKDQWPLYEALRTTAAIIFAVVGAWLAIIYPDRLKLSFGRKASDSSSTRHLNLLLTPAINSTFILVILLTVGVAAPLLKQLPFVVEHVTFFRGASFFLLTFLTIWQITIVIISVVPIELILDRAAVEDAEKKLDHFGSRHQKL